MNCCCHWGAAVSGEWPEFECFACPVHKGDVGGPTEFCKRHARICLSDGFVVTNNISPRKA